MTAAPELGRPPFDAAKLDALLEEAAVDCLLATSRHNVRYLLGGYEFFFFAHFTAIGVSGYLPCVGYARERPDAAFYVGNPMEALPLEREPLWVPSVDTCSWTTVDSARAAAAALRQLGLERGTIAVERAFLPDDAREALELELPSATFVEARPLLAELRAVKRPDELELLRRAADEIILGMLAVIESAVSGATTKELAEQVRIDQTRRGLTNEYCLVAAGPSRNRAPSNERWQAGAVSLDSGASLGGYLGDLARMGCIGDPTPRMEELLAQITAVQAAARTAVAPGRTGEEVYAAARACQSGCVDGAAMTFVAHGMGLVSHEVPYLAGPGTVPYPPKDRFRPFEPGMVLSIETDLYDGVVGFVKLEDTVVVKESGFEAYGDHGRGWNVAGATSNGEPKSG
jgi:Xaa-Pro aminopeptidase